MAPAMQDCRAGHLLPCLPRHEHPFKQVNLVDVTFTKLILFNSTKAELLPIIGLETPDNPCVQWLDEGRHIRLKVQELDIFWFIVEVMPGKVVEGQADVPLLNTHFDVQILDISDCV